MGLPIGSKAYYTPLARCRRAGGVIIVYPEWRSRSSALSVENPAEDCRLKTLCCTVRSPQPVKAASERSEAEPPKKRVLCTQKKRIRFGSAFTVFKRLTA